MGLDVSFVVMLAAAVAGLAFVSFSAAPEPKRAPVRVRSRRR
ncbi:hypothetical protein GCM10008171_22630 [Methylopila jiangsuensis]|uniref:Uncharacterized protein n=1 Tax=Methylopila jiangsuensis TaxID=586230 RepID=A0A9W6JJ46_9HYPH|nr:hypothetical protein [Methylopila jiangsuensis]MDR6286649.1 hypothetical protein [Methylopila jiangsuensis]GLK77009.1 hypothetical protein GCM10008171_22630 [Methylopila jiangsuensis]